MNVLRLSVTLYLALTASLYAADFGDQQYSWSETASRDFQDYYTRTLNKKSSIVNDFWLHYWLQQRLLKLNVRSPDPISLTETFILKDSVINAYALPGNIIAIYEGLINAAETEDELVSVLAHEMSHIALDHFTRITNNNENQTLKVLAGILLAVVLAQENADAANAAALTTIASTAQSKLNFSQNMEVEADQLAQEIVQQTEYDDGAGARFFLNLYAQQGGQEAYEYLRSHPLGTTRSTKLAGKVSSEEQPATDFYLFVKAYLTYLKNGNFEPVAFGELANDASPEWQFAYWLNKRLKDKQTEPDLISLKKLIKQYPNYLPAQFTLLDITATNPTEAYCAQLQQFEQKVTNQSVTLDVIIRLAESSAACGFDSAPKWQAQRYWQSGKEDTAMAYLNQQINNSLDDNQAARLNVQLEMYTRRYDRFR